jgi:polar amino acid transport system substrate-binding protein
MRGLRVQLVAESRNSPDSQPPRSSDTDATLMIAQHSTETAHVLAPTGRLRAAINLGNAVLAQRSPSGELQGVSVQLAQETSRQLGLPLDLVAYDAAGKVFDALQHDAWDLAFLAIDPVRAEQICFTQPYIIIEGAYLVREGAALRTAAQVDVPGHRIAASHGSAYELYLRRELRHATLVSPATPEESFQAFCTQELEAIAGVRPALMRLSKRAPGLQVLPESFLQIQQAMGLPRRAAGALTWVDAFIAEAKRSGFVAEALRNTGQDDAAVAP